MLGSGYSLTVRKVGAVGRVVWRLWFSVGLRKFCLGLWYAHRSDGCFLCILRKCRIAQLWRQPNYATQYQAA